MNRLPAWKTTKETAHAKRQVYPMTNKPHFHEPDSCTMAETVATQGKYINTKSMKLRATKGVKTGVPSSYVSSFIILSIL